MYTYIWFNLYVIIFPKLAKFGASEFCNYGSNWCKPRTLKILCKILNWNGRPEDGKRAETCRRGSIINTLVIHDFV